MPRKYVKYQKPGMGIDIPRVPWRIGNFNEISFDGGKTWVSPSPYINDQHYVGLFRGSFSVRKKAAVSAQHWIGFSPSFPTQSGHTYICTFEVRNVLSAISYGRLITSKSASDTSFDITSYPLTANQTEYTRVWHTFVQSSEGTGRAYIDACPAVAGTDIQLDIRDLRYIDVTGIDSSKYTSIGNQDWYAVRTSLDAMLVREGDGITRKGNLISLNTASEAEIASGDANKAITTDQLRAYVQHNDNYPTGLVNIAVNPTAYETTWATWKMTNASQHDVGGMKIFEWMSDTSGAGMAWHLDAGSAAMISWINGVSGKYIVSMDIKDMSEPGTTVNIGIYSAGTKSNITGVPSVTTAKNRWEHIACLVTATGTFQINIEHNIHRTNEHFTLLLKNFNIYNVTNINSSYYPAIAKGQFPLLQGVEPVRITGRSISYSKASMSDVLTNTQNGRGVVDATTLNRVINFGRIRDVTCGALGFGLWKEISFDGGTTWQTITLALLYSLQYDHKWRNGFSLRNTSSTTGQHWFGYSEPAGGKRFPTEVGHTYLFIADVRNSGAATLTKGQILQYSGASVVVSNGDALPHTANQTTYTRLYSTFNYNASGTYDGRAWLNIYPAVANSTVQVDVSGWWHFDITDLSSSDIYTLATLSAARLNDIYFRYFIQQESVSPISEVIDLGSMSAVSVQAGRVYRLTASGTHTISVGEYVSEAVGKETKLEIITNGVSVLQVNQPILLMDKIKLNAINNCTITYVNGKVKMHVDDVHQGYVVSVTSGQEYNSLYYGLTKNLEGSLEYISFGTATNDKQIEVTGVAPTIRKPISIIGNGRDKTDVTFNGGITGSEQPCYASYITIRNFTWNGGILYLSSVGLAGTVNVTGGSINLTNTNYIDADIVANVKINNGCRLYGSGSIDIGTNTLGSYTDLTINGVSLYSWKNGNPTKCFYCGGNATTIGNCKMTKGAIVISGSSAYAKSCEFSYGQLNTATGMHAYSDGRIEAEDCLVKGNTSYYDTVFASYGGRMTIRNCIITGNTTISGDAPGICAHVNGYIEVFGTTVSNNVAVTYGAGIHAASASIISATNCLVTGNTANTQGGGFCMNWYGGRMYINGCVVTNNVATSGRGMLVNAGNCAGEIRNTYFGPNQDLALNQSAAITIAGSNTFMAPITGNAVLTIPAGSTINLKGNATANAIVAGSIVVQGAITVIDVNGTARTVNTGTYTKITNGGVAS